MISRLRSRINLITCIFVGTFLALVLGTVGVQILQAGQLDKICRLTSRADAAAILASTARMPGLMSGPSFTQNARVNAACDKYLDGYLIALGGGKYLQTAAAIQTEADGLIFHKEFGLAVNTLHDRARFCESVLQLPYLAEAYQRCAVAHCRRQALAEALPTARAEVYRLLADQTVELAKMFCRRRKFEIADRAYQDSLVSATKASTRRQDVVPYCIDYAAFLYERDRFDDALMVLEQVSF